MESKTPLPKTSNPATLALNAVGIYYLEQLVKYSEKEILALHGMGPKSMKILKEEMRRLGLSFGKVR